MGAERERRQESELPKVDWQGSGRIGSRPLQDSCSLTLSFKLHETFALSFLRVEEGRRPVK